MNCTSVQQDETYDPVDWVDTDASEDEDYLPQFPLQQQFPIIPSIKNYFLRTDNELQSASSFSSESSSSAESLSQDDMEDRKRARMNSLSWDINTRELFRRKISTETPFDKVRRAIDATIDNGVNEVDISNIGLTEIPDEITELQYVTVLHNDIVKVAPLQIYLYNNQLTEINPLLFGLKNLTVLSLRGNCLKSIPPEIAFLENLVELSICNNQLKYIPAELLRLQRLSILTLLPNPYLPLPSDGSHQQRIRPLKPTATSLVEISTRTILAKLPDLMTNNSKLIPTDILQRFESMSRANSCENCHILFHTPDIEEMIWQTVFETQHIPVLYRFCSKMCCDTHSIVQKLSSTNTQ